METTLAMSKQLSPEHCGAESNNCDDCRLNNEEARVHAAANGEFTRLNHRRRALHAVGALSHTADELHL
jgi:hypothetical protein